MTDLGKGVFLVAAPAVRDPNFRQTVVLLCEHGPEGALGVVVNRPTGMLLSEVIPHVPVLEGQRQALFCGGPVEPNQVIMLYRLYEPPTEIHHVFDGVYLGGDLEVLQRVLVSPTGEDSVRAFLGYSGWAPGQLEMEMKTGSWLILPGDPTVIFQRDPGRLWPDLMRTLGPAHARYADMPADPTLN